METRLGHSHAIYISVPIGPLLMKFMFLVTRLRVILMAASIGHYWSRDLDSAPRARLL